MRCAIGDATICDCSDDAIGDSGPSLAAANTSCCRNSDADSRVAGSRLRSPWRIASHGLACGDAGGEVSGVVRTPALTTEDEAPAEGGLPQDMTDKGRPL